MPRLFVGLRIPSDLSFALSLKRGGLPDARWIDPEKYHITLRFIGDVDDYTASDVIDALDMIDHQPFNLSLGNLDTFASRKPHSLWASVSPSEELLDLQASIERNLRRMGLEPESRKFTPHVTLARLRGTTHEEAAKYLTEIGQYQSRSFKIDEFVLLSSRNTTGGGHYLVEERYPLHDDEPTHGLQADYLSFASNF